jgi:hypothetical protein
LDLAFLFGVRHSSFSRCDQCTRERPNVAPDNKDYR